MKTRTRVIISISALAGSVGIILLAFFGLRKWYNSSVITAWVVSSDEEDTTERHRQNRKESYQILPDHILLIPDKGENKYKLVRLDRQGNRLYQIALEQEGEKADKKLLSKHVYYEKIAALYGKGTDLYSRNDDSEFELIYEGRNL